MDVYASTERLMLRRFDEGDVELLLGLDADPEVMFYISGGAATPRHEIETDVLPAFLGHYRRWPGYGFFAIVERASGDFLGWVHLRPEAEAPDDEPELGYRLRRSAWGRGYAVEASRVAIDRAFADFGARRVVANTMAVHTASRRVMEKCGMSLVRAFHADWPVRIPGDEFGDVEYAITRDDWSSTLLTRRR